MSDEVARVIKRGQDMETSPPNNKRQKLSPSIMIPPNAEVFVQEILDDNDAIIETIRSLQMVLGNCDRITALRKILAKNLESLIAITDTQNLMSGENHKETAVPDRHRAKRARKGTMMLAHSLHSVGIRTLGYTIWPLTNNHQR